MFQLLQLARLKRIKVFYRSHCLHSKNYSSLVLSHQLGLNLVFCLRLPLDLAVVEVTQVAAFANLAGVEFPLLMRTLCRKLIAADPVIAILAEAFRVISRCSMLTRRHFVLSRTFPSLHLFDRLLSRHDSNDVLVLRAQSLVSVVVLFIKILALIFFL